MTVCVCDASVCVTPAAATRVAGAVPQVRGGVVVQRPAEPAVHGPAQRRRSGPRHRPAGPQKPPGEDSRAAWWAPGGRWRAGDTSADTGVGAGSGCVRAWGVGRGACGRSRLPLLRCSVLHTATGIQGGRVHHGDNLVCGLVWRGVVRCDLVWCGVVWCGAVWVCSPCETCAGHPRSSVARVMLVCGVWHAPRRSGGAGNGLLAGASLLGKREEDDVGLLLDGVKRMMSTKLKMSTFATWQQVPYRGVAWRCVVCCCVAWCCGA